MGSSRNIEHMLLWGPKEKTEKAIEDLSELTKENDLKDHPLIKETIPPHDKLIARLKLFSPWPCVIEEDGDKN